MEKFSDFWLSHDIKPLPPNLYYKLGALQDAKIVKSERSELGKVHDTFLKIMANTKKC